MNAESQKVAALRLRVEKLSEQKSGLERELEKQRKHIAVLEKGAQPYKDRVMVLAKEVEALKATIEDDAKTFGRNLDMREEAIRNLTKLNRALEKKLQELETKGLPQNRVLVPTASGILIPKSSQGPSEETRKIIAMSEG